MTLSYATHPGIKAHSHNVPTHLAITMDGNGRWAKQKGWSRTKGHQKGVEALRDIIAFSLEKKIKVLTLFAFGVENWKRPTQEVRNLFRLFFLLLRREIHKINEDNIRLRIIGNRSNFNSILHDAIEQAEETTRNNTALVLNIAVNYSGRWDLLNAISKMRQSQSLEQIEAGLQRELSLGGLPEPDLFIRTGGAQRISNFILWELAYTELYFTEVLWPDFNRDQMEQALQAYANRERRFGLTGDQLE